MGNSPNVVDFSESLSDFLATVVSDGDYSDILDTLKIDKAGKAVAATGIAAAIGQLWSNLSDDFIRSVWAILHETNSVDGHTSGATTDTVVITSLLLDGDYKTFVVNVRGHGQADNEVAFESHTLMQYRSAGTVTPVLNVPGGMVQVNLAGVTSAAAINGDDIEVTFTGGAGKEIDWSAEIVQVRNYRYTP